MAEDVVGENGGVSPPWDMAGFDDPVLLAESGARVSGSMSVSSPSDVPGTFSELASIALPVLMWL